MIRAATLVLLRLCGLGPLTCSNSEFISEPTVALIITPLFISRIRIYDCYAHVPHWRYVCSIS
jgi:hypothetical protein